MDLRSFSSMTPTRRPLTLHVSALSNAEYAAYTQSLSELASSGVSDIMWEKMVLSVREARGWIRGRYGACVDGAIIDQILRNFSPELGAQDVLTGGQFFAVMRLVCHAQAGATVDDSLVFVQANPEPIAPASGERRGSVKSDAPLSRRSSTKSNPPPVPPPRPSFESQPTTSTPATPALPPRSAPPSSAPNPFRHAQSQPRKTATEPASSNPFRISLQKPPPPPSLSSASSSSLSHSPSKHATPPLPPRKPTLLPPPRHGSLARPPLLSSKSSTYTPPLPPPPAPPKPPKATSALIKQSLQAAKGAQSVKEVLDTLSKERRAEVIRKSGVGGNSNSNSNSNGAGGRLGGSGTARSVSPPRSFYDVAAARIGVSPSPSPSSSTSSDEPAAPAVMIYPASPLTVTRSVFSNPPSHPTTATLSNPRRSKSLHHPSPGSAPLSPDALSGFPRPHAHTHSQSQPHSDSPTYAPPLPPPRRRRPESVQVTRSPFADIADQDQDQESVERWRPGSAPRQYSFNDLDAKLAAGSNSGNGTFASGSGSGSGAGPSMKDALQRTFATLRPGAGFQSVRVRAEGRVLPGGYSKMGRGGERLVGDDEEMEVEEGEGDGEDEPDVDKDLGVRGHQRYGGDDGGFGQDRDIEEGGKSGAKIKPGMTVYPGEGWVSLA